MEPLDATPPPADTAPTAGRRRTPRVSGEERERAILDALDRLLRQRPLHDLSVDDLAAGAGISRPTFYFYFASREAALLALLTSRAGEIVSDAPMPLEELDRDPRAGWRAAIEDSWLAWTANRHLVAAATEARTSDPAVAALWTGLLEAFVTHTVTAIEHERARGAAPDGPPARALAVALNRMNERLFETTLGADEPTLPDEDVVDTLTEVWLRAVYGTT